MTRLHVWLGALVLSAACALAAASQDVTPTAPAPAQQEPSMSELLDRINQGRGSKPGALDAFKLTSDCTNFGDEVTRERCWTAYREYFDYYQSGFAHRRTVFWWQHMSSRIIFVVVLGLVCAGVFFAWVQFRRDLVRGPASAGEGPAPALHQVEIGQAGVKVSSPVLGVIILVISLAFFYLYLVYVYPITEIL